MIKGEEGFITAILTQAVEDAKYVGFNKQDIKHKMEAINWIMNNDPQFTYYCKLINIEPSYIQNKIKRYSEVKFNKKQLSIVKMLERKNNESRRIGI
jgi:predicted DNA-binding ArsR family transcriptional regulator